MLSIGIKAWPIGRYKNVYANQATSQMFAQRLMEFRGEHEEDGDNEGHSGQHPRCADMKETAVVVSRDSQGDCVRNEGD